MSHGALGKSCLVANALAHGEIQYRAPRPVTSEDSLKCRNKNEEKKRKGKKKKGKKKEKKNLLTIKKITVEYNQHRTAFQRRQVFSHRAWWFGLSFFFWNVSYWNGYSSPEQFYSSFLELLNSWGTLTLFPVFPSLYTNKKKKAPKQKKKKKKKNQNPKQATKARETPLGRAQTVTMTVLPRVTATKLSARVRRWGTAHRIQKWHKILREYLALYNNTLLKYHVLKSIAFASCF